MTNKQFGSVEECVGGHNGGGGTVVTMSTYRLITLLAVSFCLGVSLSDLFLSHYHRAWFFFLDSAPTTPYSKRLVSVESIQMATAAAMATRTTRKEGGCTDDNDNIIPNNRIIKTTLDLAENAAKRQHLVPPPSSSQQQQQQAELEEVMGGGAFDPNSNYTYNRTITLIHLGKTGGSTFRTATRTLCRTVKDPKNRRRNLRRVCAVNPKLPKNRVTTVGLMIQDLFHMWGYNETLLPLVSTYLMTVRHPVDRVISSYRYSHPGNCLPKFRDKLKISQAGLPWGCQLLKNKKMFNPDSVAYKLYHRCFPSAVIEDFAQSMGRPWISSPHFETNLTQQEQWQCRQLARDISRGGAQNHGTAPHMQYNFRYYTEKTLDRFPDKELLVIRTEHQWPDMVDVDVMLGGDGKGFKGDEDKRISHGSSSYIPSPLSTEGYQKLCCILVDEVELYLHILDRAANLSPESKNESIQSLYDSCRISNWDDWKTNCKAKGLEDDAMVKRLAASNFDSIDEPSPPEKKQDHPSKKKEEGQMVPQKPPPTQQQLMSTTSLRVNIHPPSKVAAAAAVTPAAPRSGSNNPQHLQENGTKVSGGKAPIPSYTAARHAKAKVQQKG